MATLRAASQASLSALVGDYIPKYCQKNYVSVQALWVGTRLGKYAAHLGSSPIFRMKLNQPFCKVLKCPCECDAYHPRKSVFVLLHSVGEALIYWLKLRLEVAVSQECLFPGDFLLNFAHTWGVDSLYKLQRMIRLL